MTQEVTITLRKAYSEITELAKRYSTSIESAQNVLLEVGELWTSCTVTYKRGSSGRKKILKKAEKLFPVDTAQKLSACGKLHRIRCGKDDKIKIPQDVFESLLAGTKSVNPIALLRVFRDYAKDAKGTKSGEGEGTKSGEGEGTKSGEGEGTKSGENEGTKSGENEGTKSGEGEGTKSGENEGTKSGESNSPINPDLASLKTKDMLTIHFRDTTEIVGRLNADQFNSIEDIVKVIKLTENVLAAAKSALKRLIRKSQLKKLLN